MTADGPRGLARVAPIVRSNLDEMARAAVEKIVAASEFYRDPGRFSREQLVGYVLRNYEYILDHEPVADTLDDEAPPRVTGREHSLGGIPLADVLSAYRIGFAVLWDAVAQAMVDSGTVNHRELVDAGVQNEDMKQAILALYRSAAQPAMIEHGKDLPDLAARPGLGIVATADPFIGTEDLRRRATERAGAEVSVLDGLSHWWMTDDPTRAARVLVAFWRARAWSA